MKAATEKSDEELILHVPCGYKLTFLIVALTKRTLISDLKPADQLYLLEKLNRLTDRYFSAAMLAMIKPMSDLEFQIYREATSLDPPKDTMHGAASFNVLTNPKVFGHFCTLNPSILAAIKYRETERESRHRDSH